MDVATATDHLDTYGTALMDLAEVLRLADRPAEAVPLVREAREVFQRKGGTILVEGADAVLAELGG